jgi:hypothetical protein
MDINEIITGERIQDCADIFVGFEQDFQYNPFIYQIKHKHVYFHEFNKYYPNQYDNPNIIFCYGHNILHFLLIMSTFKNPFVLITHNSDENITNKETVNNILDNPLLIRWYGQNIDYVHPKLRFVPIGIANSQWPHGDLSLFNNSYFMASCSNKIKNVYFFFNIGTNRAKREPCYQALKNKLDWLNELSPNENLLRLSQYKFCICPEGNGVDTHRLWEALYLKCIPIVIKSPFTETLLRNNIPLIVLNNWEDFDERTITYNEPKLSFDFYSFLANIQH